MELAKRLGVDPLKAEPLSTKQQTFNQIAGAKVMKTDGSGMETLVTITDKDIADYGVTGKPQTGRVAFAEFMAKGVYQVPRAPGDKLGYIALDKFRKDPQANKLATASGKIEIHCKALSDYINGLGWSTIRPIASYTPPIEGYEATFADWDKKIKGDFPLQLKTTHYLRRSHTAFDEVTTLRRVWPNPFWMNPLDAQARGIEQGEFALITSRHGKTIRPVQITERIMPGVVDLPHGAWLELDDATGIDHAGSDNFITGDYATVEGHMGWNSVNVQVAKWTGKPLDPDYKWPLRIPVKEA
jgi:anaerobic dimethyl sulfoxide reductase subunit A